MQQPAAKEEFQMTREEMEKFKKNMENEEFKKLFFDYMNEISDPKNKELYENELLELEREKGFKTRFVKPKPEFCAKSWIVTPEDVVKAQQGKKAFINVCSSPEVDPLTDRGAGKWDIPYSLSNGREDVDNQKRPCMVYDVVFHPSSIEKANKIAKFKELVIITAIEGLEKQFKLNIDKKYVMMQNLKAKGTPLMTMIREKDESLKPSTDSSLDFIEKLANASANSSSPSPVAKSAEQGSSSKTQPPSTTPKLRIPDFKIIHQSKFTDYQKFTGEKERQYGARPDFLVIKIQLPTIKSAATVDLDITETTLDLLVPEKYKLHLDLPFPVLNDDGSAKFEKASSTLVITVPVVPAPPVEMPPTDDSIPIEKEEDEKVEELNGSSLVSEITENDQKVVEELTNLSLADKEPLATPVLQDAKVEQIVEQLKDTTLEKQFLYHPVPPFHSSQASDTVSFIVTIGGILQDSVKVTTFPHTTTTTSPLSEKEEEEQLYTGLHIEFGTGLQEYTFHVEFPEKIATFEWSLTPMNLCLLVIKASASLPPWTDFVLVKGGEERQTILFPTFETISKIQEIKTDDSSNEQQSRVEVSAKQRPNQVVVEAKSVQPKDKNESLEKTKESVAPKPTFVNNCLFDLE